YLHCARDRLSLLYEPKSFVGSPRTGEGQSTSCKIFTTLSLKWEARRRFSKDVCAPPCQSLHNQQSTSEECRLELKENVLVSLCLMFKPVDELLGAREVSNARGR